MHTKPQLDADEIFRVVDAQSQLGRFADAGLKARLHSLVDKFNAQAELTARNIAGARDQVAATLLARLKLARDWSEHPQIAQERIEQPLFIVGYGRTGTTVTQCLLAEDPANRLVTWAESMHPSPPPGTDPAGELARTVGAFRDLADWLGETPGILQPHPYPDHGIRSGVECEELYAIDFLNDYPTRYFRVPLAPIDTAATDPLAAYRFQKSLLQHLQWKRPTERWVLKGVFHQFVLEALWTVFPDACCVWTHRDPADVVPSILGIYAAIYEQIAPGFDHRGHAERMLRSLRAGYDLVLGSAWIDDPRVIHVRFRDFMADQVGTVRSVYRYFGLNFTAQFEDRMQAWLANPLNRSDRYGKFRYSAADFGLSRNTIAEMFSDYARRFGL